MLFFGDKTQDLKSSIGLSDELSVANAEDKARITLQGAQHFQEKFREQIEHVFSRQFREKLVRVSDLVSDMVILIQREPEKLKAMPLLLRYLDRIEHQLAGYIEADLEGSDEADAPVMRNRTEQMIDTVIVGFEEVKRDMQRSNYMELRVGNKTLEQIFEEFAPIIKPIK